MTPTMSATRLNVIIGGDGDPWKIEPTADFLAEDACTEASTTNSPFRSPRKHRFSLSSQCSSSNHTQDDYVLGTPPLSSPYALDLDPVTDDEGETSLGAYTADDLTQWSQSGSYNIRTAATQQVSSMSYNGLMDMEGSLPSDDVTTVVISGLPPTMDDTALAEQFRAWGLDGSYNTLYMIPGWTDRTALVNFIKPCFSQLCQLSGRGLKWQIVPAITQEPQAGKLMSSSLQRGGSEAPSMAWPKLLPQEMPELSESALKPYMSNSQKMSLGSIPKGSRSGLRTGQIDNLPEQLLKTQMCKFFRKGRCILGQNCTFAHRQSELHDQPDFRKTKLCHSFHRNRCCTKNPCNFAHGVSELRTDDKEEPQIVRF
jgi:hypothetical protein